jgi:hypothetical protein
MFLPSGGGGFTNFSAAALEADLPRIEAPCDRFTGQGCTTSPPGANFYPIFTIGKAKKSGANTGFNKFGQPVRAFSCQWQLGGAGIPGTVNTFGGTPAEYGTLLPLQFVTPTGTLALFDDFQNAMSSNPCPAPAANLTAPTSLKFGARKIGSPSTPRKLLIFNNGPLPVTITGLTPSTDYTVTSDGCTGTLAPAGKCTSLLVFDPTKAGNDNGTLVISGNASNAPLSVALIGDGQ